VSSPLTINTATQYFFDRVEVKKATGNMNRRGLSKIGAGLRTKDQRSQRPAGKKGKVSRPGEPPRTHERPYLRRFTYFVYDPASESVVVGPVLLNGAKGKKLSQTVPNIVETGGDTQQQFVILTGGLKVPANSALARRSGGQRVTERGVLKPRPHTKPAFDAVLPTMPEAFKGTFTS
jgi:hypothetical protein